MHPITLILAASLGQCLDGTCLNPFRRDTTISISPGRLPRFAFTSQPQPQAQEVGWVVAPSPTFGTSSVYMPPAPTATIVSETWLEPVASVSASPQAQPPTLPSKVLPAPAPPSAPLPLPTTSAASVATPAPPESTAGADAVRAIGELSRQIAVSDARRDGQHTALESRLVKLETRVGQQELNFKQVIDRVAKFETGAFTEKLPKPKGDGQWKPIELPPVEVGDEAKPTPLPNLKDPSAPATTTAPKELQSLPLPSQP